jgi:hypothetical protein
MLLSCITDKFSNTILTNTDNNYIQVDYWAFNDVSSAQTEVSIN